MPRVRMDRVLDGTVSLSRLAEQHGGWLGSQPLPDPQTAPEHCPRCGGDGEFVDGRDCPDCAALERLMSGHEDGTRRSAA